MSEIDDILLLMETENRFEDEEAEEKYSEIQEPKIRKATPVRKLYAKVPKKGTKEYETYRRKCMNGTIRKRGRPFDPEVLKRNKEAERKKYLLAYYKKYRADKRKEFLLMKKEKERLEREMGLLAPKVRKKRKRRLKDFLPYESAMDIVRYEGIKSVKQYKTWYKFNRPGMLPADPAEHYRKTGNWNGWGSFLGTSNTYPQYEKIKWRPYNECVAYAQTLGNINTMKEWIAYGLEGKHPKDVPTRPDIVYRKYGNQWVSWNIFLRKKGQINSMQYAISQNTPVLYVLKLDDPTNTKLYRIGVTIGGVSSIRDAIRKYDLAYVESFKIDHGFDWKTYISRLASPHWDGNGIYEVPNIYELNLALGQVGIRIDPSELA
ncbi:hypothetical protein [Stenotrophomonas phage RAS14]